MGQGGGELWMVSKDVETHGKFTRDGKEEVDERECEVKTTF